MTSPALQFPLDRGERQLWSGWPRQGIVVRSSDALVMPFSCLWAGFAVFWELSVWRTSAPFPFLLFGVPFLLVGLYITIGRFFFECEAPCAYGVRCDIGPGHNQFGRVLVRDEVTRPGENDGRDAERITGRLGHDHL